MPRRKYSDLPFSEAMKLLQQATLQDSKPMHQQPLDVNDTEEPDSLQDITKKILGIVNKEKRKSTDMLFFIMYDIESNKVRNLVFKYLKKQGCINIQRSVFLGDLPAERFNRIKEDLTEVQSCYDNSDSILVVPISTDYLKSMKIIGKEINMDIVMKTRNTLFF